MFIFFSMVLNLHKLILFFCSLLVLSSLVFISNLSFFVQFFYIFFFFMSHECVFWILPQLGAGVYSHLHKVVFMHKCSFIFMFVQQWLQLCRGRSAGMKSWSHIVVVIDISWRLTTVWDQTLIPQRPKKNLKTQMKEQDLKKEKFVFFYFLKCVNCRKVYLCSEFTF